MSNLTDEQQAVVHHPRGHHARVLAVAGSGKTTTMTYRVKHLVETLGVSPRKICILMFNRRAREQFKNKLVEVLPPHLHPQVHTFHSYAYSLISEATGRGLLPDIRNVWVGDKEELFRIHVHKAINNLVHRNDIPPDIVDVDEAMECISLWKGSLIPPDRAGHRTIIYFPLVYQEFERLRLSKNAITFDDFVPLAVGMLEVEPEISQRVVNTFDAVIVDEYQDVNYGQQRLIELIASQRADIMVVGDDDQTIYEWRGARPIYITHDFVNVFDNKPTIDYQLSHTFRFGPLLAQCAQNVISLNLQRRPKRVIAHFSDKPSWLHIIKNTSEQHTDVDKELANQVLALVKETHAPEKIIVLARMFAQLVSLEAEFLHQKIPYRVIGRSPFFERREIVVLMDYLRLAWMLDQPMKRPILDYLLSVANVPNRKISKDILSRTAHQDRFSAQSVRALLHYFTNDVTSPFSRSQVEQLDDLLSTLEKLNERMRTEPSLLAGEILEWLISRIDYLSHFDNYYGKGETSEERKRSVTAFCKYARQIQMPVGSFLTHIHKLDTTRGVPKEQQIVMTTIFRVKGEDFDFVFIPNCEDGYMPCPFASEGNLLFDKAGIVSNPEQSDAIENERRLFYVAITRAKKAVFIGTSSAPELGLQASSNMSKPSGFLQEMTLEPTKIVVHAFQRAMRDGRQGHRGLIAAMMQHAGHRAIINNLLQHYLPMNGIQVSPDIVNRIHNTPEIPPKACAALSPPSSSPAPSSVSEEPKWWEDDEDRDVIDAWFGTGKTPGAPTRNEKKNTQKQAWPENDIDDIPF